MKNYQIFLIYVFFVLFPPDLSRLNTCIYLPLGRGKTKRGEIPIKQNKRGYKQHIMGGISSARGEYHLTPT